MGGAAARARVLMPSPPRSIHQFHFITCSGDYAKGRALNRRGRRGRWSAIVKALNTLDTPGTNRQVVLVAEDEAIIGFELAESLRLEGFEVAGPFDTCASAEAWFRLADHLEGATLRDGPCTALARDLRSRGIPFVVYSGHSRSQEAPSEFGDAPWVVKPVPFEVLLRALQTAIA